MSQQSEQRNESRESHYQRLEAIERRSIRRSITIPFILLILILLVIWGIVLSLRAPNQVAILSDLMFSLFVLCPLVICLIPIVILMVMLISLMNRAHRGSKSPLRRLEQWTYEMEKRVENLTGLVDNRVLNWAVRFAPIRRVLTIFDTPPSDSEDEEENHGKSTTGT